MNRYNYLRKYITKEKLGLEIAPYHSPICRKAEGYNVKILDVFDTERLHENAKKDPLVRTGQLIEEVDYVGSACDMGEFITDTKFDYIVSSHNFEHLPDPIKFLQGAQNLLKDDGVITMAVPDYRYVFDVHKFPTRLCEFLRWHHTNRTYNDPFDIFHDGYQKLSDHLPQAKVFPSKIRSLNDIHKDLIDRLKVGSHEYVDVHNSFFTPSSLRLLMMELNELAYINLEPIELIPLNNFEIIIYMKKSNERLSMSEKQRSDIHFDIIKEMCDVMRFR